jgi:hypothetical protein
MPNLNSTYMIIDDYAFSTGPGGGAGTGQPLLTQTYNANTLADAARVAHIIASALQRPVRLQVFGQFAAPYTLIQFAQPGGALTSVPSGITY